MSMEALRNGTDPVEAFPYITRDGIIDFPFLQTEDGRLEPDTPPENFKAKRASRKSKTSK